MVVTFRLARLMVAIVAPFYPIVPPSPSIFLVRRVETHLTALPCVFSAALRAPPTPIPSPSLVLVLASIGCTPGLAGGHLDIRRVSNIQL